MWVCGRGSGSVVRDKYICSIEESLIKTNRYNPIIAGMLVNHRLDVSAESLPMEAQIHLLDKGALPALACRPHKQGPRQFLLRLDCGIDRTQKPKGTLCLPFHLVTSFEIRVLVATRATLGSL